MQTITNKQTKNRVSSDIQCRPTHRFGNARRCVVEMSTTTLGPLTDLTSLSS